MKKVIRLTEDDLTHLITKVINESNGRFDYKMYLKFLRERKKILEDQLSEITKELGPIKEQLDVLEGFLDPKVSISISKYSNGSERYIGRFLAKFPDGTSKQVAINIGPVERFNGRSDPRIIEIAKEKAIERYGRINPDYIRNLFNS
jgi:hypothetical protein